MATDEFEQTGRTSGQRLFAERQKEPPEVRSRTQRAADAFASSLLSRNPSIGELNQRLRRE